jgi:hypothetical protein
LKFPPIKTTQGFTGGPQPGNSEQSFYVNFVTDIPMKDFIPERTKSPSPKEGENSSLNPMKKEFHQSI